MAESFAAQLNRLKTQKQQANKKLKEAQIMLVEKQKILSNTQSQIPAAGRRTPSQIQNNISKYQKNIKNAMRNISKFTKLSEKAERNISNFYGKMANRLKTKKNNNTSGQISRLVSKNAIRNENEAIAYRKIINFKPSDFSDNLFAINAHGGSSYNIPVKSFKLNKNETVVMLCIEGCVQAPPFWQIYAKSTIQQYDNSVHPDYKKKIH